MASYCRERRLKKKEKIRLKITRKRTGGGLGTQILPKRKKRRDEVNSYSLLSL